MAKGLVVITGGSSGIGLAASVLYCYQLPPHLCIRDLVVAPTKTTF